MEASSAYPSPGRKDVSNSSFPASSEEQSVVLLSPGRLEGNLQAPPSKSASHRMILCAALSALCGNGDCFVGPLAPSQDITATLEAVQAMGVQARQEGNDVRLSAGKKPALAGNALLPIDCGESGSTLRFLIPIAAALGLPVLFTGKGRLPQRPIGLYKELLPLHGVSCETEGGLPFSVRGKLASGFYELPGNISSQFITGLMLALPILEGESEIYLTSPLQSASYVDMTVSALRSFGVTIFPTGNGWRIPGGQQYASGSYTVEGDWSQAAFFLAAGALSPASGKGVCVSGLLRDSLQGDKEIFSLLSRFGAKAFEKKVPGSETTLFCCRPPAEGSLSGIEIDASQIPDLVPILAVIGAFAKGETRIFHAERLRIKESDRLAAMAEGLSRMGADITETSDGLFIQGGKVLQGAVLRGWNDHRIVMSLSIAALSAQGQTQITDPGSIRKSFPDFFTRYNALGGNAYVRGGVCLGE